MKKLSALFLLFSTSLFAARYQVISQHPHDVKVITPYVKTISVTGRLWIVEGENLPASALKHLRLLDGNEKHYAHTPFVLPSVNPRIKREVSKLSETLIRDYVIKLASYKTRLVGTADNIKAVEEIEKNLSELGFETSQICYASKRCSVLAEKKGSHNPEKVILTEAHMDSVGRDFAGADDNASGTAVLMEMARVLSTYKNKKTLRFFVTNGEESGLKGAEHYARLLKSNSEIKNLELVINMDMVGWNKNGIVELETDAPYESLATHFSELAVNYTTLKTKITIGAWGSDHVPFLKAGVPSILTIEDWSTKTPCYHSACDKPEGLNYAYATEIGKLNVAAVMAEDLK